jgi:hypothetical protein
MPRTTIAAVLAMLLCLAPAASARPADVGYPAYPTPEVAAKPMIQSERITDHPLPPTAEEIKQALAQEQSYSTKGNPNVATAVDAHHAALVREHESTSGSGNQGHARAASPANVPAPSDDDAPWLIVALGIAGVALGAGALAVVHRNRTRSSVAV